VEMNSLKQLREFGQSVWIDYIRRDFLLQQFRIRCSNIREWVFRIASCRCPKPLETIGEAGLSIPMSLREDFTVYLPESQTEGRRRHVCEGVWPSVRRVTRRGIGVLAVSPAYDGSGNGKIVQKNSPGSHPFRAGSFAAALWT
jgi:hypothetical protein